MKHLRCKFRKLANTGQRSGVDEKWRQIFRVAFPGMHIEKEIRQRSFEPGALASVKRESGARDFCGARQIQNAGALAHLPMGPRHEIEVWRCTPAADLDVAR